jgi:uncharacterized membrane protein YhaH (DUF805 family)
MNFSQAIASGFRNYVTFSGRASRSEYWYWVLFAILGALVTGILDRALFDVSSISATKRDLRSRPVLAGLGGCRAPNA